MGYSGWWVEVGKDKYLCIWELDILSNMNFLIKIELGHLGRTLKKKQKIEIKWWISSLKNNRICFQTLFICFLFLQRRKRKKPRGKIWFINLLQKLVFLQNDVNQKVRETVCFAKVLNPGWEGVKSIPKTSQSLPINGSAMRANVGRPWELLWCWRSTM